MRSFEFNFRDQVFKGVFQNGAILYDREEMSSFFGIDSSSFPSEVRAAQVQHLLPAEKIDSFKEWHQTSQNTLFEIIKMDNEID